MRGKFVRQHPALHILNSLCDVLHCSACARALLSILLFIPVYIFSIRIHESLRNDYLRREEIIHLGVWRRKLLPPVIALMVDFLFSFTAYSAEKPSSLTIDECLSSIEADEATLEPPILHEAAASFDPAYIFCYGMLLISVGMFLCLACSLYSSRPRKDTSPIIRFDFPANGFKTRFD